jgi:hypothetical protein
VGVAHVPSAATPAITRSANPAGTAAPNLVNAASSRLKSAITEAHDSQAMVCARSASLNPSPRAVLS